MAKTSTAKTKTRRTVGLDIGSYAVKVLEASVTGEKVELVGIGYRAVSGMAKDQIAGEIKRMAEAEGIATREVAISVSGPSVIVRFITMPKMTDDELKSAVRFEAEKFIPFNISECIIDFQILGKGDRDNKMNVVLVTAKKAFVEERIALAEAAGFAVTTVDVDSFSVANAFWKNNASVDKEKTLALINVGMNFTALSIVRAGAVLLVRDMPSGTKDIAATLAKEPSIDDKKARELILDPQANKEALARSLKSFMGSLVEELRLPFSYYENQFGRSVDDVYLTGGGACIGGFADAFADTFESKPVIWDPLAFLDKASFKKDITALDKCKSAFAVVCGLALR